MEEKDLRFESRKDAHSGEESRLKALLSHEHARLIIAEFEKQGIDIPSFKDGYIFVDEDTGAQYAYLPFRASKTGQIHASLNSIDDFVQGVYVPLTEETWETLTVVTVKEGQAEVQKLPWRALRGPGSTAMLSMMADERSFITLKATQQETSYKAMFLMGDAQVAIRDPDIGYYMLMAVCAV